MRSNPPPQGVPGSDRATDSAPPAHTPVSPLPPDQSGHPTTAIVTGAESGIGRAIAVALAGGGVDVGITYLDDADGAERTAREVAERGATAAVRQADLTDLPTGAAVVDALADEIGGVGVLVNNAGMGSAELAVDMDYDTWRRVVAVDLDAPFLCAQRAARRMIAAGAGGRIINITSVHEHAPRVGSAPYCAAKGGLGLLTKVLAQEFAEYGITVNAVAPGEIATPLNDEGDVDPTTEPRSGVPLGRPGSAHEVAAAVAFLVTPAAGYVTGASLLVDGGLTLMGPQAGLQLPDDRWRRP